MNCIVAQRTVNKKYPADIALQDTADFSALRERLRSVGIFESVYSYKARKGNRNLRLLGRGEQRAAALARPSEIYPMPKLAREYSALFLPRDSYAARFFYYGLLELGMAPDVGFVGEGASTYAMDFGNTLGDGLDHARFGDRAFLKKLGTLWCYQPELCLAGGGFVKTAGLPPFDALEPSVREAVDAVFGRAEPVKEKLVYFEGAPAGSGGLNDEMPVFLAVADRVGRENLAVRLHPDSRTDRFGPLGFRVLDRSAEAPELLFRETDLSQKVLASAASFGCYVGQETFGRPSHTLLLKDLIRGAASFPELRDRGELLRRAERVFNRERKTSWNPLNTEELSLTLDMLEEWVGGWSA